MKVLGLGKLVIAVLGLLIAASLTAFLFNDHPYTVSAYFLSAEGLVPQNDVVIGGMPVGTVQDVRLGSENQAQGGAIVVLQLDKKFAPLHQGTHATIRQKGLLGNMFIDVTPGPTTNAPIPSGGVLPIQDTSTPVDLDQITDIFDPTTRQKIQTMTRQGGVALNGNGPEANKLLAQLPTITSNSADITNNLDSRYAKLDALTVEFDNISYQMASEDQAFRGDLVNGASILNVLAAHDKRLQDEITYGNLTLSELNTALNGHQGDLNTLLKEMPGLLDQTQTWSDQNSTALAILDPCVNDIIQAIAEMQSAQAVVPDSGQGKPQPGNVQPGNPGHGQMLHVSASTATDGSDTSYSQDFMHPPSIACSGGTP